MGISKTLLRPAAIVTQRKKGGEGISHFCIPLTLPKLFAVTEQLQRERLDDNLVFPFALSVSLLLIHFSLVGLDEAPPWIFSY